jgi:hypothetical protein
MEIVPQPWTKSSTCNQLALTVVFSLTVYILLASHFGENKIFLSLFLLSYNNGVAVFSSYISMWVLNVENSMRGNLLDDLKKKKNSWPINWMLQLFFFYFLQLRNLNSYSLAVHPGTLWNYVSNRVLWKFIFIIFLNYFNVLILNIIFKN